MRVAVPRPLMGAATRLSSVGRAKGPDFTVYLYSILQKLPSVLQALAVPRDIMRLLPKRRFGNATCCPAPHGKDTSRFLRPVQPWLCPRCRGGARAAPGR